VEVTSHSHYDKLVSALRARTRLKLSQRSNESANLLRRKRNRETLSIDENGNSTITTRKFKNRAGKQVERKLMRRMLEWPLSSESLKNCDYPSTCISSDDPAYLALAPSRGFNTCEVPPMQPYMQKPLCSVIPGTGDREEKAAGSLWVRVLLGRLASERLPPTEESFGSEIRDWRQCAGDLVGLGERSMRMCHIPCAVGSDYCGHAG
jgi:hypothetical protein